MTVASAISRNDYTGNGSTAVYAYGFRIFVNTDLRVIVKDSSGVETVLTLTTDYTVSGVGGSGGNVTLVNASQAWLTAGNLSSGYTLTIKRVRPLTQLTDIRNQGEYYPEAIEDEFDKGRMIDLQQQDDIDRSLKFPETALGVDGTLPELEADKYLKVNATGDGFELGTPSTTTSAYPGSFTSGLDSAKAASPTAKDVYIATDTQIVYICYSSGTWVVGRLTTYGTDAAKAATPKAGAIHIATDTGRVYFCYVAGTWSTVKNGVKGADIASATTCDIGAATGDFIDITGTTTITGLGTIGAGAIRFVKFSGILTLTHNASSLILPGGVSITTAAGDTACFASLGSGNWRCLFYSKASGAPISDSAAHFREGLSCHWESGTTVLAVEAGSCVIGGTLVRKADRTTLSISTAGDYAGGASLQATNTTFWIGVDSSGNLKLHTTAATHSDSALSVTTGKKRYVSWGGTTYRVIGWGRFNGTGSGEIDTTRVGNIKDVNTRNVVYYETTANTAGSTSIPIDTSYPQITEGVEMLKTGIVIGDAQSKIKVSVTMMVANSSGGNGAGVLSALFKTGTSNAKRSTGSTDSTGATYSDQSQKIDFKEAAGAVGWQEWSVRCGQAGSAMTLNYFQNTAIPSLGSVLELEEVDP